MKFYRITTCNHVNDLSGEGAFLHGGRWNSKGTRVLYTAESMALAMLEALAHVTMVHQKRRYCRVVLEAGGLAGGLAGHQPGSLDEGALLPDPESWYKQVDLTELPGDFRSHPGPDVLKAIGDRFVEEGKFLALKVPSVVVPDSYNFLLNPAHAGFTQVKMVGSDEIVFDQRIVNLR